VLKISQSQYVRGEHCIKSLWLDKYRPQELSALHETAKNIFETGSDIGVLGRQLFPGGVLIEYANCSFDDKLSETRKLMVDGCETIYEATFEFDNILVMVDILHKTANGWQICEVKSSTSVSPVYLNDVSIQFYVLSGCGINVSSINIAVLNSAYVLSDALDVTELFKIENVTKDVLNKQLEIPVKLKSIQSALEKPDVEPNIDIGLHCNKPYQCNAQAYCWRKQRDIPEYSVFNIFNNGPKPFNLYKNGIIKVDEIPENMLTTAKQRFIVDAYKSQKTTVDTKAIELFLKSLKYPIYHFDFETFQSAIPEFKGMKPFQQIPFQYSLHIQHSDGKLVHKEFLAESSDDPRLSLVKRLVKDIPKDVTVMVYNETFEKKRLEELACAYQEYSCHLLAIHDNIVDLAQPFQKKHYYHPELNGKYSIKVVLPHLVPELATAYKDLELVQNGGDAMNVFPKLKEMSESDRFRYRKALLNYCKLDTIAMVEILNRLKNLASVTS